MVVVTAACTLLWCATVCVGEFEISSHWLNTTEDGPYDNYKTENTSSWWAAANTVCTRSGGHLFVPRKQNSLDDLTNLLDENKVYWVGGFQYSSLIWTADVTRYYRRLGVMLDVYGRHVKPSTIDDNSPFMCNVRCGNNSGLFGLKGRSCYCLGDGSKLRGLTVENMTHTEIRCPGDYNELCGDDKRISVYAGDMTSISSSGTCGYVRKISDSHVKSQLHLDDDCTKKRFYAYKEQTGETSMGSRLRCRGGVCVSNTTESWTDAVWKTRGLLKVTDANRESLYSAMHYRDYWIGLRRRQEYKWINGNHKIVFGNSVARNMSRHYLDKRCLAVRRDDSHVHVAWYPCSDTYRAVCQSIKPDKTDDDRGIYLGVAATIVSVFMLCLIGAVIHFKRKGLCCFKANGETDSAHSANSPSPLHYSRATVPRLPGQTNNVNATDRHKLNILDAGVCDGDAVYSVIDGPECPGCSDPYTDPIRAAGVEDGEYNTTRQAHGRRDDNTYNHIRTGYDREGSDQDGNLYHEVTEA